MNMSSDASAVHGHEVIEFLRDRELTGDRDALAAAVRDRFGAEARFFTCSAEGLDSHGIISFLEGRGILRAAEKGLSIFAEGTCAG